MAHKYLKQFLSDLNKTRAINEFLSGILNIAGASKLHHILKYLSSNVMQEKNHIS